MNGPEARFAAVLLAAAVAWYPAARAQNVTGTAFEDRDADGIQDPGEPGIEGVAFRLLGTPDAGGSVDQTVVTGPDGAYSFGPGPGCYMLAPSDPAGWRASRARDDGFPAGTPGYLEPVGQPRFGKMNQGLDHLAGGAMRFTAMGDSIAWNWNVCGYEESFWYSKQVQARMQCVAPAASVTLDDAAVKGEHTDDLLVDDHDDLNNVFRVVEIQPQFITISMIGNDLLDVEPQSDPPTQGEINTAVAEVLDSRSNLQEAISTLLWKVPGADLALNSLYDNEAYDCLNKPTNDFHRTWLPIVNRILRDLAWGQARRCSIVEAAAEFAHEDQVSQCTGFDHEICVNFLDGIHPNNSGYTILREKLWEAVGGTNLGPRDALGRDSLDGVDYGFLRRVRRIYPTAWEARNGASVENPEAALNGEDGGAAAGITLGAGSEEFVLSGFPDWYDEVVIVRVIAGVRYRTTGTVADDFYRMEASVHGDFRPPPGHAYTPTDWNYYTPIVGGGGPNQPPENPDFSQEKLLAYPDVAEYREVTATLTDNPVLPQGASDYEWPPLTHEDLSTTAVRVASAPVAATPGNDSYRVELDAAWLDLYGWEKPRPDPVRNVLAGRRVDGTLDVTFDAVPSAQRYNLYFGRLGTVRSGSYDHGRNAPVPPSCDAPTEDAGGGRLRIPVPPSEQPQESSYFLVTAHVDDVEAPSGFRSDGTEIDRSESTCR